MAECFFGKPQKITSLRETAEGNVRGVFAEWYILQFEHGSCDDTKGAFRTNEQVFEIVTRVVFQQMVHGANDGTIGQDDLQAQHQIAHDTVTQSL